MTDESFKHRYKIDWKALLAHIYPCLVCMLTEQWTHPTLYVNKLFWGSLKISNDAMS